MTYNNILLGKFRALPKTFKKTTGIQKLFNESAVKVEKLYQSNQSIADEPQYKKKEADEQQSNERQDTDFLAQENNVFEELISKVSAFTGRRGNEDGGRPSMFTYEGMTQKSRKSIFTCDDNDARYNTRFNGL